MEPDWGEENLWSVCDWGEVLHGLEETSVVYILLVPTSATFLKDNAIIITVLS